MIKGFLIDLPIFMIFLWQNIIYISFKSYSIQYLFYFNSPIFMVLRISAIIFSIGILWFRNPIHALVSLIGTFSSALLILVSINVEFLALTFLIIYVGAIAILFLFVIMMFNLKKLQSITLTWEWIFTWLIYVHLVHVAYVYMNKIISYFFINHYLLFYNQKARNLEELLYLFQYKTHDISLFSDLLYTNNGGNFILIGVILLTAMVGSIVLALSTIEEN